MRTIDLTWRYVVVNNSQRWGYSWSNRKVRVESLMLYVVLVYYIIYYYDYYGYDCDYDDNYNNSNNNNKKYVLWNMVSAPQPSSQVHGWTVQQVWRFSHN